MFRKYFAAWLVLFGFMCLGTPVYSGTFDLLGSDADTLLWADLMDDLNQLDQEREAMVAESLGSVEAFQQRRTQLEADYDQMVGYLPQKNTSECSSCRDHQCAGRRLLY